MPRTKKPRPEDATKPTHHNSGDKYRGQLTDLYYDLGPTESTNQEAEKEK
jgi:hypothetical protein